jgi:two-component system, NtrC family, sensor kinase
MSFELSPEDVVALNRLVTIARVLAGTVHDVNNALQIIGGSAELLEGQDDLPETARRSLQRIRGQSARAAAAMEEVMAFARDRADVSTRVSLRDIVAKAASMRGFQVRRAGLTLVFDAATQPPVVVMGRFAPLLQVVLNLILNAEQSLGKQPGGAITLALTEEGSHVVLTVSDNGPGISAELGERAFDPFVGTRARIDGPGLGLPAARAIVRAHGGDLTLVRLEPGTRAVLRIPLATV